MITIKEDAPCPHCGRFLNRGVSIDAVIIKHDNILLIQRSVEPNEGFWATPGGYVEWNESIEDTVRREVKTETGLDIVSTKLVGVYSSPGRHPQQVINNLYVAQVRDDEPKAGGDAKAVSWFPLDKLPEKIALDHRQNIDDARKFLGQSN